MTLTQKTEAEFGDPSALDLFFCGVALSEPQRPLERLISKTSEEGQLAAQAPDVSEAPDEPPPLGDRVAMLLGVHGSITVAELVDKLGEPEDAVSEALARLHLAGTVEPDDGGTWRLSQGEDA